MGNGGRGGRGGATAGGEATYSEQDFAEALTRTHGVVLAAARALGCNPATVWRAIKRHPDLVRVREEAKVNIIDLAERGLHGKVEEGNLTACIFTLKCLGKDRGYIERTEVEHSGEVKTGIDLSALSAEDLKAHSDRLIRAMKGEPEPSS